MSKIKLVYFDFNFWRIDILRLSLAYAGIDYEFERIPREDWTKFKNKHPFGQLPIMYYEDNIFCHTHSLAIFCASRSNLYSNNEKKQIVINQRMLKEPATMHLFLQYWTWLPNLCFGFDLFAI